MESAIRKLFNLYAGEGRKAGLFILLALLWGIGGYGVCVLSEGLFLEHVGAEALPTTYLAIAIGMCLLSSCLITALSYVSVGRLLISVISIAVAALSVLYFLYTFTPAAEATWFWYVLKVVGWMTPISCYILYWAFVDQYFDLQDAKRFFCFLNSFTFLADACGGGMTSFLLDTLGISNLLLVFLISIAASIPCIALISSRIEPVLEEVYEGLETGRESSLRVTLKSILTSRFTLILMVFYLVMQLLAIVTEYNYMGTFERVVGGSDGHDLTKFLGTCGMFISLGNMLIGLLLYGRLVKKMGVNNIIVVAPAFFLAIFAIWIWKEALPIALLGLIAREGMVYTFDDNNLNLLISGVPTKIKNKVRVSIEAFFEPIGMFLSGALLFMFQAQSQLVGLLLACAALGIVLVLRSEYAKAIFHNLVANSIRFEKKAIDWITGFSKKEKREVEFLLLSHLKKTNESTQLLAYEYLIKTENKHFLPHLLNHLGRLSIPGKLKAIELLATSVFAKEAAVVERLERWRRSLPHPSIKSAIHFYLARHALLDPERIIRDLDSEHLGLHGAAILALKTADGSPNTASRATEKLTKLLGSDQENEVCMGLRILGLEERQETLEELFPFLKHPSLGVRRTAAHSLMQVAHPRGRPLAPELVALLPSMRDPQMRLHCLEGLEKLRDLGSVEQLLLASVHFRPGEKKRVESIVRSFGESSVPVLQQVVRDEKVQVACRLLAGKILGALSPVDLRSDLLTIANAEISRAYFYFYHAHTIQQQVPEHDLSILVKTLHTSHAATVDFIVQLLGAAGSIEESEVLSHSLHSKNRKVRAHAIETLEKAADPKIYALLTPFIYPTCNEDILKEYLRKGHAPYNLAQLLDALAESASLANQIVSITLKSRLNAPNWKEALHQKLSGNEDIFHHFAYELLKR